MYESQEAAIEGILFAMGESVRIDSLAEALGMRQEEVRERVRHMMGRYAKEDRGIQIIEVEDAVQLCTKKEIYEYLIQVAKLSLIHI